MLVAGEDITDWDEDQLAEIRRRVTMVFQSGALFDSLTVREVRVPLEEPDLTEEQKDARVEELAKCWKSPRSPTTALELSTGMKHAVAIRARALAQDPKRHPVRRADDDGRSADGGPHG